jgi:oligosaccharide reducing-end xylanase
MTLGFRATVAALLVLGCSPTTDSLGTNRSPTEQPPPASNTFGEVLGKSDAEVRAKVAAAFEQLFYGDPDTEAIYFESGADEAYVLNAATGEVRTDGLGYGMMIAVELDKPDEFARLWKYTQSHNQFTTGSRERFLYWDCPESASGCPDPNGMQYAALALYFAATRWGEPSYAEDADGLLEVMLHREELNLGVVDGVVDVFDPSANVVRTSPEGGLDITTPSFVMPAFTELFAERGADADQKRWNDITTTERALTRAFLSTPTGLPTELTDFAGAPLVNNTFGAEAHRVGLNLAVDHLWHGVDWAPEIDTMLEFLDGQSEPYAAEVDAVTGEILVERQSPALQATTAAAASAATTSVRDDFIQVIWDMPIPTGDTRYYDGVLYLMSLLVLSDQYEVY